MRFVYAVALALIALQSAQASSSSPPSSSSVSDSSSSKSSFSSSSSSSSSSSHDSFSSLVRLAQSRIKHVVVLMMENRSFDHMLGWLHTDYNDKIDGLKPGIHVPRDPHDLSKGYVEVSRDGYDVGPDDPLHNFVSISTQIDDFAMDGFIYSAIQHHHNETNPVAMFDKNSAPVINQLAQEFAVFDKWFCSVPGPTDPNRAYSMAGTSVGVIENFDGNLWQQQSYFDLLTQNNHTWAAYYQQDVWAVGYFQDMQKPENSRNMKDLDDYFWNDVANGTLPEFTWLQPRSSPHTDYGLPTWQHPDASVSAGEQLYHDVYTALRSSSLWNSTLFIITYDEHGGFYDHVPPPNKGIPNPDGIKADNGFNFDTLGIRVPTIAISPWIPRNTIVSSALPFEQPTATSQFDATSIMATTHAILGLTDAKIPLLGARASWSNTFIGLVTSLAEPRTDCPITIAGKGKTYSHASTSTSTSTSLSDPLLLSYQRSKPINDHQYHQILFYCKQLYPEMGQTCPGLSSHVTENQGTAADWTLEQSHIYLQRLRSAERAWLDEKEFVASQQV